MPKLTSGASGASEASAAVAAQLRGRQLNSEAAPTNWALRLRNWRRLRAWRLVAAFESADDPAEVRVEGWFMGVVWVQSVAMEIFAKQTAG